MTSAASRPAARATGSGEKSGVVRDLAVALPVVLGTAGATWWLLGLAASYLLVAVVIYVAMAGVILALIPSDTPGPGLSGFTTSIRTLRKNARHSTPLQRV